MKAEGYIKALLCVVMLVVLASPSAHLVAQTKPQTPAAQKKAVPKDAQVTAGAEEFVPKDQDSDAAKIKEREVEELKKRAEQAEQELQKKEKELGKAEQKKQEQLLKKQALETEVKLKEKAAEIKKQEVEAVKAQAEATGDATAKGEVRRLGREATQLQKEATALKQQLKVREQKVGLALETAAAKQTEIDSLKEELERLEQERAQIRGTTEKILIVFAILLIVIALLLVKNAGLHKLDELVSKEARFLRGRRQLRVRTTSRMVSWALSVALIVGAGFVILKVFGFNPATLLAGAGIIGIALGFGGQYLIRDIINGLFILTEGQYAVGDIVKMGEYAGLVEDVNLRYTKLRDMEGRVIYVPNGDVKTVVNYTKEYARAVITIRVSYKENVDRVMDVIKEIGKEMREDAYFGTLILEDLEMWGVDDLGHWGVEIIFRMKTLPMKQWEVAREYRRRLKNRFDELHIEIPVPFYRFAQSENPKDQELMRKLAQ